MVESGFAYEKSLYFTQPHRREKSERNPIDVDLFPKNGFNILERDKVRLIEEGSKAVENYLRAGAYYEDVKAKALVANSNNFVKFIKAIWEESPVMNDFRGATKDYLEAQQISPFMGPEK